MITIAAVLSALLAVSAAAGQNGRFPANAAGSESTVAAELGHGPVVQAPDDATLQLCASSGVAQFNDVSWDDPAAAYILCMRALGVSVGQGAGRNPSTLVHPGTSSVERIVR